MAKEAARERAVHRYYQPWLETFGGGASDLELSAILPPPSISGSALAHRPRSSRDKALTAFAQLGCLRLNAKRSIVTLLGATKQYIIAEATKTLSLLSDAQHGDGDELWFGNAFLDRKLGISADAMTPDIHTAYDPDGSAYAAPALVVCDLATHDVYKTRSYAGKGVNFWCGVPITNNQGHVIGVYTVTDDQPRERLSATELRFLVDMSVIVMAHLETVKNDRIRKRGERLIYGIGGFIEGDEVDDTFIASPSLQSSRQADVSMNFSPNKSKTGSGESSPSESQKPNKFSGMVITDANTSSQNPKQGRHSTMERPVQMTRTKSSNTEQGDAPAEDTKPVSAAQQAKIAKEKVIHESQHVFDRAASILRYCLGSDGVMFFDASSANLSSGSRMQSSGSVGKVHHSKPKEKRSEEQKSATPTQSPQKTNSINEPSTSADDSMSKSDSSSSPGRRRQKCQLLGRSVVDHDKTITVSEQALRRLVRRYPKGKCFAYDQFGQPAFSDEGSESASAIDAQSNHSDAASNGGYVPTTSALLKALPGARSVVFLPLWDFSKERWHSGLVVWSNDPGRLTNVEDNMIYLKAFSSAIMNEVNRIDLLLSDAAKSTFLANISHELRSPLHGILGSIEFLHDTALDDFQSSMVISVETCGKTLLDTVNHVLDYAKIHNLSKLSRTSKGATQNADNPGRPETSLTEDFDMAVIFEEAVEAVYAGQVFRNANADAMEGRTAAQTSASRALQQRQDKKNNISKAAASQRSPVSLSLNIENQNDWKVRSQPGAIRRIVMNILGNALKYTSKGSINVALEVDRSRRMGSSNCHLMISIADTGQGMRNEFLQNHAFTAFSQENSLATGTGLGLSIVRQIVDSLGGKIDLTSEKDVGTDVRIYLSLPRSKKDFGADLDYNALPLIRGRTEGLEMCMLSPKDTNNTEDGERSTLAMPSIQSSMEQVVTQWFGMKITTAKTMEGISPNFFVYPEPPPIDYLLRFHGSPATGKDVPVIIITTNFFEAAALRSNGIHQLADIGRVIEIVAQPVGPQKLGTVLHRCMQRLEMLEKDNPQENSLQNISTSAIQGTQSEDDVRAESYPRGHRRPSTQADGSGGDVRKTSIVSPAPNPPQNKATFAEPLISSRKPSYEDKKRSHGLSASKSGTSDAETDVQYTSTDGDTVSQTHNVDQPRVLVVDDNHINLHLLVTFVRKSGHPYESASDGLKALEAYKRSVQEEPLGPFKYILMDISMPVMNGISATKEIRKFEKEVGVKVPVTIIALTGMGSDVAESEAREAGFDQFLSKPVKFRTLVKLLV